MKLGALLADGLAPVVDLVYPSRCPVYGDQIAAQRGLCLNCWSELAIPGEPACALCQRPFADAVVAEKGALCGPCLAKPPRHDGIAAGTLYTESSRKLVLALKHGGRIALASTMAPLIAARLPEFAEPPLLVPVPLHRWRLWRRGFNQAAVLARELERLGKGRLLVGALVRTKDTRALGGLGRKERERMLRGAIGVRQTRCETIKNRDVVLVDDVLTSGATSDACVRALKRSGARSVVVACFARVLDDPRSLAAQKRSPEAAMAPGDA